MRNEPPAARQIVVECASCHRKLRLGAELAGKTVRCPACQGVNTVPGAGFAASVPARAEAPLPVDEPAPRPLPSRRPTSPARGNGTPAMIVGIVACVFGLLAFGLAWFAALRVLALVMGGVGLAGGITGIVLAGNNRWSGVGLPIAGGSANLLALLLGVIMLAVARNRPAADDTSSSDPDQKKPAGASWGTPIDPDGDCTITPDGKTLTIVVPPTVHDLSAEINRVNAPRVLRTIEGDFTVQVKVCGRLHPAGPGNLPGRPPYQGAGLLLWGDAGTYIRLERAAYPVGGPLQMLVSFERRIGGRMLAGPSAMVQDRDMYLRMQRRGGLVSAWYSVNGQDWVPLAPQNVVLPARVRVGVAALNTSPQPFTIRFEDIQLSR